MPHITVPGELPGLLGLFAYRPDTAGPLLGLVQALMEGPSTLTKGERELIGSLVSQRNDCAFCTNAHGAFAAASLEGGPDAVRRAQQSPTNTGQTDRVQALIDVALAASESGHAVTDDLVQTAISAGATEREVHDAVLIASTFALFTRYVDGLGTVAPQEPAWYTGMAGQLSQGGYSGIATLLSQQQPQPVAC